MTRHSTAVYYATNLALVYTIIAIFYAFSLIHINLYYLLKILFYGSITISRWTDGQRDHYLNNTDRFLTGILPIVWIFVHALTHTMTCHTTEHLRGNMWLDIIVHTSSAFITLYSYIYHYRRHHSLPSPKPVHDRFLFRFKLTITYLTIVAIWCCLSCYVSYVHVKSPEDGDRLYMWWIGSALSFVNFTTVNVYDQSIFSKRFIVESLVGFFVFSTQVTRVIPTKSYILTRYFETYLLGALFCRHYIDFDTFLSDIPQAHQKTVRPIRDARRG